eukprot:gene6144-2753_t
MDGKLVILATAVARIKVSEELSQGSKGGPSPLTGFGLGVEKVMGASAMSAAAGVAASSLAWGSYEYSVSREQRWDGELPRESERGNM